MKKHVTLWFFDWNEYVHMCMCMDVDTSRLYACTPPHTHTWCIHLYACICVCMYTRQPTILYIYIYIYIYTSIHTYIYIYIYIYISTHIYTLTHRAFYYNAADVAAWVEGARMHASVQAVAWYIQTDNFHATQVCFVWICVLALLNTRTHKWHHAAEWDQGARMQVCREWRHTYIPTIFNHKGFALLDMFAHSSKYNKHTHTHRLRWLMHDTREVPTCCIHSILYTHVLQCVWYKPKQTP